MNRENNSWGSAVLNETFKKRFAELEVESQKIHPITTQYDVEGYYNDADYIGWATNAQSLIRAVFGGASPYYENFVSIFGGSASSKARVDTLKNLFLSAKGAFEGGYIFNVELTVSGELFGDFVAMAKHALSEGHKDVAAVLACAALEDTLKRYALVNGLTVDGYSMQDTANALKSKGLVKGAQKTLLESMPKIRDYAMHANWDKITEQDAGGVIGYVEHFLLSKFSGPPNG